MAALKPFRRGMPLSLVIVRYFFYVIAAIVAVCAISFFALSSTIEMGIVYPASYGPGHVDETVEAIRSSTDFDSEALPTAYRYARIDGSGALVDSNLSEDGLESALRIARDYLDHDDGVPSGQRPAVTTGENGTTYTVFDLPDGTVCLLTSTFMPQFSSRSLSEALPNPQNLMLVVAFAGSAIAVLLIARRASRVIERTMAPLTDAADRIAHEDLAFTVGSSNVLEVNNVLGAMERMRSSLEESLEARWRAEQAQRNQVAALAHDLKTPLTLVRANAEYVVEETQDLTHIDDAANTGKLVDITAAARDAATAAERLDNYVRLLIEVSRGDGEIEVREPVQLDSLADELGREADALARAADIALDVAIDPALAGIRIEADREALRRAVTNVVANALDHASERVELSFGLEDGKDAFRVEVCDDGPGFSAEALERGCERFFRGDSSRTGFATEAHYGIGLAVTGEAARMHGGTVELSNTIGEAQLILGACVVIRIPM